MTEPKPSEQLNAITQAALGRKLTWRERLVAWLRAHVGRGLGPDGGYWGGVFTHALGTLRRAGVKATAFLRR